MMEEGTCCGVKGECRDLAGLLDALKREAAAGKGPEVDRLSGGEFVYVPPSEAALLADGLIEPVRLSPILLRCPPFFFHFACFVATPWLLFGNQ